MVISDNFTSISYVPSDFSTLSTFKTTNIAGRLPENSRNRFVDRQSKKNIEKKDRPKKFVFSLKADLLYFD